MLSVCAWCKKELSASSPDATKHAITHGICNDCYTRLLLQEVGVSLHSFLDFLEGPVLLINAQGSVVTANKQARETLGKDLPEIEGQTGGKVMECAYARLPGGCGNTEHCKACAIRNAVMHTQATGEPSYRQSCYQDINTAEGMRRIRFLISTQKVEGTVLLRIDDAVPSDPK